MYARYALERPSKTYRFEILMDHSLTVDVDQTFCGVCQLSKMQYRSKAAEDSMSLDELTNSYRFVFRCALINSMMLLFAHYYTAPLIGDHGDITWSA